MCIYNYIYDPVPTLPLTFDPIFIEDAHVLNRMKNQFSKQFCKARAKAAEERFHSLEVELAEERRRVEEAKLDRDKLAHLNAGLQVGFIFEIFFSY